MSDIVPRLDALNNKVKEVNDRLAQICKEGNILFLSHAENIHSSTPLHESKLHLNHRGIKVFANNFCKFLVKLN